MTGHRTNRSRNSPLGRTGFMAHPATASARANSERWRSRTGGGENPASCGAGSRVRYGIDCLFSADAECARALEGPISFCVAIGSHSSVGRWMAIWLPDLLFPMYRAVRLARWHTK